MIPDQDEQQLIKILRAETKRAGLSQAELARQLDISIATAKRWLKGEGLDLKNLSRVLKIIGISWTDFAEQIDEHVTPRFQYTVRQEEALSEDPLLLLIFDDLLRGSTMTRVQNKLKVSYASLRRSMRQLEELGLIELHVNDRVKLKKRGEPEWRPNGPLAKKFRRSIIKSFCERYSDDRSRISVALHRLQQHDVETLQRKIAEIIELAATADQRAKRNEDASSTEHALMLGFAPFGLWDALQKTGRV
jgi:transcriptional regulator with XRE-family HTH domain